MLKVHLELLYEFLASVFHSFEVELGRSLGEGTAISQIRRALPILKILLLSLMELFEHQVTSRGVFFQAYLPASDHPLTY